ncbi:MAG TPA: glycosyltransferase [Firmicutes bacterium]|nr:glycosyltransferase [Bacillota bacterium]
MSMEHKKIYITSLHMKHGGVEMMIASLANAFVERGAEVEILCTYHLGEPVYTLSPDVKIRYLTDVHPNREDFQQAIREKRLLSILHEGIYALKVLYLKKKTMKQALSEITEGTVVSTRNEHSVLLSKYGRPGVHKIAQLHHDHAFDQKLISDFQKHYENIDEFLILTPQNTKEIQDFIKDHNSHMKCLTVPNFVENLYHGPWPERKNQVIAVGRLAPEKGFDRLLAIWQQASTRLPGWTLKIIGEGQEMKTLREKARSLGIEDSVCFSGALPHEEVLREMASSKIYAMTSFTESFGLVLVEAQSCKLPVIAFDVRVGPRAILTEGKDGFLVKDGDLAEFCEKMIALAANEEVRSAFGENARENAKKFEKDRVMQLWEKILL